VGEFEVGANSAQAIWKANNNEDDRVWRNRSLQPSEWRVEHLLSPADLAAASARLFDRLSARALRFAHVARDARSLGGFRFVTDI